MGLLRNQAQNFLINGNFDFWQRGTSFVNIDNGEYGADRFQWIDSGISDPDITRDTDVPTFAESGFSSRYSMLLTAAIADTPGAADYGQIRQVIEGQNAAPLYGKTFTLSFWVKSDVSGIFCVSFNNDAFDRAYIAEYTINATDTWEKKTITVTHDNSGIWKTDNGRGIAVIWSTATGADRQGSEGWQSGALFSTANQTNLHETVNNKFRLAQVQINPGPVAAPFERAGGSISGELVQVQRYFEKSYHIETDPGTATSDGRMLWQTRLTGSSMRLQQTTRFQTRKRTNPTHVLYDMAGNTDRVTLINNNSGGTSDNQSITASGSSEISIEIAKTTTGAGLAWHWTADAEL